MVMPLTITIITSCAIFSLDNQLLAGGVGVVVIVIAGVTVGVAVGLVAPKKSSGSSVMMGVGVGIGVLRGVGVRAFSVTTTVYLQ